ncbi:hypothetical protein Tco_0463213 [Tanacetum coccineum]
MIAIQAEEGEGLGHPSKPQPPSSTTQPTNEEPIPNVVSSSHQKTQTPRVEMAITTAASLNAKQASGGSPRCQEAMGGSITQTRSKRVPTKSYDSPLLRVHTAGSDKGSMTLQELMVLCTTLSKKVESLEADLKQKKKVYAATYTKLIKKVKNLEKTIKSNQARRRAKIVVSDDDEDFEDSSKKGRMIEEIDQDTGVTLVTRTHSQEDQPEDQLGVFSAAKVLADAAKENVHNYTRRRRTVSTGSGGISTASRLFSTAEKSISTAGASMLVSTTGMVQEVNISIPSPVVVKDKGKAVVRLQEELDEEERQRMARVHEAAQSFIEEEWENIKARVKADEELSRRIQAKERNNYSEVDQEKMLVDLINQRKKYFLKELFETTMKNVNNFVPRETEDRGRALELAAGSSQATIIDYAEVRNLVMSDSEDSTVTYTEVSSPFEDLSNIGSPGVDGLPMILEDPYVEAALQAPPSPDYVSGPKYPPLPEFVLEHVYPEFMPPEDEVFPAEEQPLLAAVSLTTDSPGYIANSDPEEDEQDPEEDPTDYLANGGDDEDDDDESSDDDDDDDVKEDEDEEEEHPASADSVPQLVHRVTARMSIRQQPPTPFWSEIEIARLLDIPSPPSSPHSPYPTYPLGYRAAMIWLRAETPSTSHPLPSSTPPSGTPPLLHIPLPTPSPPLILPSTICRAGVSEVTLPPRKSLCIALGQRYEVGESSSIPTSIPTRGFRVDYGFVATLDDEIRSDLERDVSYGIIDTWDEMLVGMPGDRRAHARAALLTERDARLSHGDCKVMCSTPHPTGATYGDTNTDEDTADISDNTPESVGTR